MTDIIRSPRRTYVTVGTSFADYIVDPSVAGDCNTKITAALAAGGHVVLKKNITYTLNAALNPTNGNWLLEGEDPTAILKVNNNTNVSVFNITTEGLSNMHLKGVTLDQNGANQTSAGGGFVMNKFSNLTIEYCVFKPSYNFQMLLGSGTGTNLTGTMTFTSGDATVSGSSTLFTTELSVGMIIKTNGGKFVMVASIASNTSLELNRQFEYTTETGVAASKYTGNTGLRLINNDFQGSAHTDNVGLGLMVGALVQGNDSHGSGGGYGFGPDHCFYNKFIGNNCYENDNDGIGVESCGYSEFIGNNCYESVSGNGIRLLSGSYRNLVANNVCRKNVNGINVTYNDVNFGKPNENTILGNICELNTTHGIRVGGAARTMVNSNRSFNNGDHGIVTVTDNSIVPDLTSVIGNQCYDSQDTKTQERGIYLLNSTNALVDGNISRTTDHVTAGITDSGTGTTLGTNVT